ncbi:hypothetical protein KUV80_02550 [Fictibacillus nanhaiensis]|uniref:hypothetical protein n=1 Tax=Fictibacillus nanhaiensis TaxID=742169 RepID=UPI001C954F9F|nr:hypothetical protein [Fictibacillus nanhaiensis]MBY6035510.1 hypothetical protein [Fictibacillus nanhaiensis]
MNVYYGIENLTASEMEGIEIEDSEKDLSIIKNIEEVPKDMLQEVIPLLQISPLRTTQIFDDYGFFSENRKCYLYLDMIIAFSIKNGLDQQEKMFHFQVEEELLAVSEDENKNLIFFLSEHNKPLLIKWAASYEIDIEFIL